MLAQAAIKTYNHSRPSCRTARGREPLRAQTRVIVPCVPNRASSSKQTRTSRSGCASAMASICSPTISLKNACTSGSESSCWGRGIRLL